MRDTEDKMVLRKDIDFQHTFLEGLYLQFKEAAGEGLLSEYEDLIDVMYSMFPSKYKRELQIWNADLSELSIVNTEWQKALKIGPAINSKKVLDKDPEALLQVRQRCLRKAQIVTDIAEKLKLIGEEFPDIEMDEDESEVYKMVKERAR